MLYQPTSMIPSSFSGEGNDVISASDNNTFSALIAGSSTTVGAYQVIIRQNSVDGEVVYNSGVVVLDTPFNPTDYNGVQNRFEIPIPASGTTDDEGNVINTMVDEYQNGYVWTLSLWEIYDSNEPESTKITSVEQFFWAKVHTSVSIIDPQYVVTSRENLWKAQYNSSSSVQYFQWTLMDITDGIDEIVKQTKRIYGTSQIWFEYKGLISGRSYAIQVLVVNQYGVSAYSPWLEFSVDYPSVSVSGATSIMQKDDYLTIDWSGVQFIEGEAFYKSNDEPSDNYSFVNDIPIDDQISLNIGDDTYIKFESSNTFPLELNEDGVIVWSGKIPEYDGSISILDFTSDDGTYSRTLSHEGFEIGLVPSNQITPSSSLMPKDEISGNFVYLVNQDTYMKSVPLPTYRYNTVEMTPNSINVISFNNEV